LLFTPVKFAEQKMMYNKSPSMLHMYRTQSTSWQFFWCRLRLINLEFWKKEFLKMRLAQKL